MLNRKTGITLIPEPPPFTERQMEFARQMEFRAVHCLAAFQRGEPVEDDLVTLIDFCASARRVGLLPPLPEG